MVIIFTKNVCGGCEALKSYLGEKINHPSIKVMNINEHPDMIEKYNLQGAPTTILFNNQYKEIIRSVGFSDETKDIIDRMLEEL